MPAALAGVARALGADGGDLLSGREPSAEEQAVAACLDGAGSAVILLGGAALLAPQAHGERGGQEDQQHRHPVEQRPGVREVTCEEGVHPEEHEQGGGGEHREEQPGHRGVKEQPQFLAGNPQHDRVNGHRRVPREKHSPGPAPVHRCGAACPRNNRARWWSWRRPMPFAPPRWHQPPSATVPVSMDDQGAPTGSSVSCSSTSPTPAAPSSAGPTSAPTPTV